MSIENIGGVISQAGLCPARCRKSSEIKPFHGCWNTFVGKAYCIKDNVLLDETCGSVGFSMNAYNEIERGEFYGTP